ncbi:small conductance calcium-activated potassium channel protein 2-like [Dreissena polymorpha]|uniref:Potassium channel domain-containing protein n=1 Tax=Dreissena polymorpha TaxID=45954 RepID=A0A9D4IF88_DREPO|nr:small conductance calcium-activated potassium channel protein 2-like [Dreissena polymorpha]KAH3771229.1 hypothetical protein DPMN_172538 [Dreissena polymorpha]
MFRKTYTASLSYYGGLYKKLSRSLRRFNLHPDDENLKTPLFKDELLEEFEMKSYGGVELIPASIPGNGHSQTLGQRLERRCQLIKMRRIVIDVVCGLALLGIVLMVIETEFYVFQTDKSGTVSFAIKIGISVSTLVLLVGICYHYYIDLKIKALDSGVRDWNHVVTNTAVFCLLGEILVCSVHPFPGDLDIKYTSPIGHNKVSIDAILSIFMMCRLYLIAKLAVVHSRLLTDTSINSIGALSKIKINTLFVFKAVMTDTPAQLLVAVMLTTFVVNTWAMRTCESYYLGTADSYIEVMWLIATTFLTVGYGDKIPQSYCGRYISICTALMGVVTLALMVAVLAQKLEQTRSEKYVFNMMSRIQVEKRRKTAAANVIKALIHLWMVRKYSSGDKSLARRYSDQLKTALRQLRIAKREKAHIDDFNVGIIEVSETVNRIHDRVDKFEFMYERSNSDRNAIESRLASVESKLDEIRTLLSIAR